MNVAPQIRECLAAGLALVPIPPGKKGPIIPGWNLRDNAVRGADNAPRFAGRNAGLLHAWSRTCAIDVDDYDRADGWLREHGVDIAALLMTPGAVQVRSPRPNRAKLLYRLPDGVDPLASVVVADGALELRCASRDGLSVQDVIAGAHPEGGEYTLVGNVATMVELPHALLELWQSLLDKPARVNGHAHERANPVIVADATLRDLRDALRSIPADAHDVWIRTGHALHELGAAGHQLWDEWSRTSAKYDAADAGRVWASLKPSSTGYRVVFAEARRRGWQNPLAARAPSEPAIPSGAPAPPQAPVPCYPRPLDLVALAGREPPPRSWFVEGMIPRSANVLFSAHGGTGKTLLALQLAVCLATGKPFFGLPTTQATVLAVFAEDDADELHRRLAAVCAALEVSLADVADRLHVFDAVGVDVSLFSRSVRDLDGRVLSLAEPDVTPMYDWAEKMAALHGADVLMLDSISDTFDADEIRRAHVRRYLTRCLDLVLARRGAVIQIAHVDKAAARGAATNGQSFSGSTGWHNGCRSRIALRYVKDEDNEAGDDDRRELVVEKLNYGRPGQVVPLRYDAARHVFVRDGEPDGIVGAIRSRTERRAVLKGLAEVEAAGRSCMTSPRATENASTMLGVLPSCPPALKTQAGRKRLFRLVYELEADGLIAREAFKTASRHLAERWRLTPAGQAEARANA